MRKDKLTACPNKQEVRCPNLIVEWSRAMKSVQVTPTSFGYVNLVMFLTKVEEATFEPTVDNNQSQFLRLGIVKHYFDQCQYISP